MCVLGLSTAIMVPAQSHLHGEFVVDLPVVHQVGGFVPPVRLNVPVTPLEEVGGAHHEFRQRATGQTVIVVPELIRTAARINPGNPGVIAAFFAEA